MDDVGPVGGFSQQLRHALGLGRSLALATISPAGMPHAAMLYYAGEGPTLVCWAHAESATVRNVGANPLVAFAIAVEGVDLSGGDSLGGIQGSGDGRLRPWSDV